MKVYEVIFEWFSKHRKENLASASSHFYQLAYIALNPNMKQNKNVPIQQKIIYTYRSPTWRLEFNSEYICVTWQNIALPVRPNSALHFSNATKKTILVSIK